MAAIEVESNYLQAVAWAKEIILHFWLQVDLGVDLKSRLKSTKVNLSRLEALGSGRVVFIWGPSRILVGSFDCFQVDLFHMNVIFAHFTCPF